VIRIHQSPIQTIGERFAEAHALKFKLALPSAGRGLSSKITGVTGGGWLSIQADHASNAISIAREWKSIMPTKQKLMLFTDTQIAALEKIMAAKGETYAELVRRLLANEAASLSIEWPDDMPTREETMREAQKKRWPKDEE
jgi:hypothetical protein